MADSVVAETLDRPAPRADDPIDRRIFYPALGIGGLFILWGVKQLLDRKVPLLPFGEWFVGAAILHDAVLAPALIVIGWLLARGVPRRVLAPLTAGLVIAGAVLLYSIPALLTDGAQSADPSTLPNDQPRNVLLVLAVIVLLTAAGALLRRRRTRPHGHDQPRNVLLVLAVIVLLTAAGALLRGRRTRPQGPPVSDGR